MDRNPQAKQMADESMVRNLRAQADAIWPQEEPVFRRHGLPDDVRILDVGCGTGEIALRLASLYPRSTIVGVDIIEPHLEIARERCKHLGDRVQFRIGDAFELPFPDRSFDLVVCRHVLQAIPTPERVLAQLVRVTRAGGVVHVIPEDYDMIHVASAKTGVDVSWFWHAAPRAFGAATQTDLHIGRNCYRHLRALPVDDIRYDYVHVDTLRVPRETFANIFTAWRDGYVEVCAIHLAKPESEIRAYFDATIATILDPDGYALWLVPVVSARVR
jgi:ubiquinone/menaquinone biosynthesis C-methylase UbiE